MAKELDLDALAEAMHEQQNGVNNKQIVWDGDRGTFVEKGSFEPNKDNDSVVNDVSRRPFYSL